MADFPSRLRYLRQSRSWTQEELGRRVNVTKVSVSGYESGNRMPDTDTLQRIADVFGVSVDYVLGRTDEAGDHKGEDDRGKFSELPPTVRAWLRLDPEGLSEEEQEELAEDLEEYFKLRKERLLRKKRSERE